MTKVLHLASWYPNRKVPQEGDFIQRQLQALAGFTPVQVIAVIKDENLKPGEVVVEKAENKNVFETTAYYNSYKTGIKQVDSLVSFLKFRKIFRQLIRKHVAVNGKPELIHVHIAFRAGTVGRWAAAEYGVPYIVSEHWSGYKNEDKSGLYFQPPWIVSTIKRILAGARFILPVSESLLADIKMHTNNRSFAVIHNVVNESLFAPPAVIPERKFRFLHVSTMGPEKQPQAIFHAFDTLRQEVEAELVCLGTVPEGLEEWVINNVRFHEEIIFRGNVPYEEVAIEMRDADCLLIASVYETFSCVAAEALLSGLPVISTPVGIVPELIDAGNGRIFKDEAALVPAMLDVYRNIHGFDRNAISRGQQGKFSYQTIGSKLVELYKTV